MRIIQTARQQHPIIPLKFPHWRYLPAFVLHDEPHIAFYRQGRIVHLGGAVKVAREDGSVAAAGGVDRGVGLVCFEDEEADVG